MPNKSYTVEKVGSIIKLTEREELIIYQLFSREEVKAGDYLLKMGEVCNKTWLIEKGLLQFNIVKDGEYRTFVFRGEGEFTSDLDSFINKSVSQKKYYCTRRVCSTFNYVRANADFIRHCQPGGEVW
jgi:hypothetical protein